MAKLLILNGPNLNLLGSREPEHYGHDTLETINKRLEATATAAGHQLRSVQSNAEHELVDQIQAAKKDDVAFIIINAAALTHTSIAIRDAFSATAIPFIEVHLSNVYARETFRHHSCFADIATGVICGLGPMGYELALQAAIQQLATD